LDFIIPTILSRVNNVKADIYRNSIFRTCADFFGIIITLLLISKIKRKYFLTVSLLAAGVIILLTGVYDNPSYVNLMIILQAIFGSAPAALIYMYIY
jgi:hypothetical protein